MMASHKTCVGRRVPQVMLAQRSSSILVQRPTNDISFHLRPSSGTCINDSDDSVLLLTAPTPTVHSAPSPEQAGKIVLLRRVVWSFEAKTHFPTSGRLPTTPVTRIARITALVVLDDRLTYVSALRSDQRGPSSVHSAAEVARDSIISVPHAPAKKPRSRHLINRFTTSH